jgi:hypothetical protein
VGCKPCLEASITSETPIYVDLRLKSGVKGQDVANKMHRLGFKRINLATGYDSTNIEISNFIESVQGKDFPAKI